MQPHDVDMLLSDLIRDEGIVLRVYDDATGMPIGPGTLVKGHPTIGIGRALDINGVRHLEAAEMCRSDIAVYVQELGAVPWFLGLDANRQRAVLNMRHTLGLTGLFQFRMMIMALQTKDWNAAAAAVLNSRWAEECKDRAERIAHLIATGTDLP